MIFVVVAAVFGFLRGRVDFFECEFEDVGEGGGGVGGGVGGPRKGDVDGAGFIGFERRGGDDEVFRKRGFFLFVWRGGRADDADVGEDVVGQGVFDVELEYQVRGVEVLDAGDDVFGFGFGEVDDWG